MKMIMKSVAIAGVTMLAVTTMLAKGGGNSGLPVHTIRFTYKVVFTNTGAQATAAGTASASESINNTSDKETLNVSLKGLNASDTYSLIASGTSQGSNFTEDVEDFSPSKNGTAKLDLKNTGNTKTPAVLTGPLDPVSNISELDVVDDGDFTAGVTNDPPVTILTADTTSPATYTFQDKQTTTSTNLTGAAGTLMVSASNKSSKLTLTATGLVDSTLYVLSLNGSPAGTNSNFTSTSKGTLKISTPLSVPVLDLTDVDLDDSTGTNNILFFPMP